MSTAAIALLILLATVYTGARIVSYSLGKRLERDREARKSAEREFRKTQDKIDKLQHRLLDMDVKPEALVAVPEGFMALPIVEYVEPTSGKVRIRAHDFRGLPHVVLGRSNIGEYQVIRPKLGLPPDEEVVEAATKSWWQRP